jgi:hypothetical protein
MVYSVREVDPHSFHDYFFFWLCVSHFLFFVYHPNMFTSVWGKCSYPYLSLTIGLDFYAECKTFLMLVILQQIHVKWGLLYSIIFTLKHTHSAGVYIYMSMLRIKLGLPAYQRTALSMRPNSCLGLTRDLLKINGFYQCLGGWTFHLAEFKTG